MTFTISANDNLYENQNLIRCVAFERIVYSESQKLSSYLATGADRESSPLVEFGLRGFASFRTIVNEWFFEHESRPPLL